MKQKKKIKKRPGDAKKVKKNEFVKGKKNERKRTRKKKKHLTLEDFLYVEGENGRTYTVL